jgi:hypothetical protein
MSFEPLSPGTPSIQRFNADSKPFGVATYSFASETSSQGSYGAPSSDAYVPQKQVTLSLPQRESAAPAEPLVSTARSSYGARSYEASPAKPVRRFNDESSTSPFTGRATLEATSTTKSSYPRFDSALYRPPSAGHIRQPRASPADYSPAAQPQGSPTATTSTLRFEARSTAQEEFTGRAGDAAAPRFRFNESSDALPLRGGAFDGERPRDSTTRSEYQPFTTAAYAEGATQVHFLSVLQPSMFFFLFFNRPCLCTSYMVLRKLLTCV